MRREQTKQIFQLQLLALVLAFLLLWYSINPAPHPVSPNKSEGELPDQQRRELEPQLKRRDATPVTLRMSGKEIATCYKPTEDEDDFEWPEFIDA